MTLNVNKQKSSSLDRAKKRIDAMENRYGEITQNEIQENKQTNKKGSIGTMGHSMEDSQKIKDRTTT